MQDINDLGPWLFACTETEVDLQNQANVEQVINWPDRYMSSVFLPEEEYRIRSDSTETAK